MRERGLARAIAEWRNALGPARVSIDSDELRRVATPTYKHHFGVVAILRPRSREEVQACVRIASRHAIPLYANSRGQNWGYGSKAPWADGCAYVDLSSMDRIVALDRELATVTVEPGVTTTQLWKYLTAKAPELAASLPSATSPLASVMGNALDGGVGAGLYADRFGSVYSLEVVVGTGETIHTGLDRLEGAEDLGRTEAHAGPSMRELFVQSSFGIVTRMTIGLFPVSGTIRQLLVPHETTRDVGRFVDHIRRLMQAQVIRTPVSIHNDYAFFPSRMQYPWALTRGRSPLPTETLTRLREALDRPRWKATIDIQAFDAELATAHEKSIRRELRQFEVTTTDATRWRRSMFAPNAAALPALYWRKRLPFPSKVDPHRDMCGFMWCDYVLPAYGRVVTAALDPIEPLVRAYGFEPHTELYALWPRALYLVVLLMYDRALPGADDRAAACHRALSTRLHAEGVVPTRLRVGTMDHFPAATDDSSRVFGRVRSALDPANVIAPGRYDFGSPPSMPPEHGSPTFRAIERIHLDLIDNWHKRRARPASKKIVPLRAHYFEPDSYDEARDAAESLAPLLEACARSIAKSPAWRTLAGITDAQAEDLVREASGLGRNGTFEGAFDLGQVYRVFRFAPSSGKSRRATAARASAAQLASSLAIFALLTDPRHAPALSKRARAAVARHVPWTRFLARGKTTFRGRPVDVVDLARSRKDELVLRPTLARSSQTWIGEFLTERDWRAKIREALASDIRWVVQERVQIAPEVFPCVRTGDLEFEGFFVGVDVEVVRGKAARQLVARIAEEPRVGPRCLEAIDVPTILVARGRASRRVKT